MGRQTEYIYDSIGNLTRTVRRETSGGAIKALACFEYDTDGLITASVASTNLTIPPGPTDSCTGNKTKFGYDTYGNQTCVLNARFSATTSCADEAAEKATSIYDLGGRVLYSTIETTNDVRPVKGQSPETEVSQCGPLGTGNNTDDDGDGTNDDGCPSQKFSYDAQNSLLTATDGLDNTATKAYDAKGNVTSTKDANRKTAGVSPESGISQCGADGTGDGENDDAGDDTIADDGCLSSLYHYDNADRLDRVVEAAVSPTIIPTTSYGYDANGNRTLVTDAKRQPVGAAETQCGALGVGDDADNDAGGPDGTKDDGCPSIKYAFDALDRLQSQTDAGFNPSTGTLGRTTSYQYDASSNVNQRTDARGLVTKYFPDPMSRMDYLEHWNGSTRVDLIDFIYDDAGNRTLLSDPTGITTYAYDWANRVTSVTFPGPKTVSYVYDDLPGGSAADYPGTRTKITYPDATKYVAYTSLADGRMSTATDWSSNQTSYTYDSAGRLGKTQYPNSVWADYTYDAADRLTSVVNKKTGPVTLSSFTYTLDAVGNRTQMDTLAGTHSYQYDALYRLTQVTYPLPFPGTDTYSYDANGNRLTKNATAYGYDAANQMVTAGGISYGYDQNGNQTSAGLDTFTYDHENRLTQSVIGGVTSSSSYNGDGLRMSHSVCPYPCKPRITSGMSRLVCPLS